MGSLSTCHINPELALTASFPLILRRQTVCNNDTAVWNRNKAPNAARNGVSQAAFFPERISSIKIREKTGAAMPATAMRNVIAATNKNGPNAL